MEFFDRHFARIHHAANEVAARPAWNVLFVSHRGFWFDVSEFDTYKSGKIASVHFCSGNDSLLTLERRFDIAIMCNSTVQEHISLFTIRRRNLCDFVFIWTFDNHHAQAQTLSINTLGDAVIPSHQFAAAFMKSPATVLGRHVPLSTHQWSRARAQALFDAHIRLERKDGPHGGFLAHGGPGEDREAIVKALQTRLPSHGLKLIGPRDANYFDLSPEERWLDWARYKVGLILPFYFDLPIRFFDSLLTGQVPVVPDWCRDFDAVIPPEMQKSLPIIRFGERSPDAIEAACRNAAAQYDKDGIEGARRRHLYAREHHHVANRLEQICAQILPIAAAENLRLDVDATSAGFTLVP